MSQTTQGRNLEVSSGAGNKHTTLHQFAIRIFLHTPLESKSRACSSDVSCRTERAFGRVSVSDSRALGAAHIARMLREQPESLLFDNDKPRRDDRALRTAAPSTRSGRRWRRTSGWRRSRTAHGLE